MKKIKINFIDFWENFNKEDNYFCNILKKYYEIEFSEEPDYLFCSCFGNKHFQYTNCIKILFIGENIIPDFNLYDYAMGFHYIEFEDRYLRLPLYVLYHMERPLATLKHTFSDDYYLAKKKFCNYVISNPYAAGERDRMAELLNEYQKIDSGGKYRNNVGGPVEDKIAFEKNYRFTMAFENSKMSGYTTEKILEAFAGDTIPIYWGSPNVSKEFNPKAFINCNDYDSLEAVVEKVKEINENDELYLAMIKEPAVVEGSQAKKYLEKGYADNFLLNIFEQEKEQAIRRNMVYVGRDYQKKMKDSKKIQDVLDFIKKPMHQFNKIKYKISSKLGKA